MNIMTIAYLHGAGGAERQIVLLSNELARRGHNVTLCVLAENNSNYPIENAVNIIDLSHAEGTGKLRIVRRCMALRKAIRQIRPEIIVNYNLQSAYFCLTLPKSKRGKVVYSERGDPYDDEYSGMLGIIRDFTVLHMDGLVVQSEGARDFFPESVRKKSIIIHNSVNVPQDKFPQPECREKRIVSVGRLHPQKNQRLLIDAFSIIARKHSEYVLDIYGDGRLRGELMKQANDYGLSDRIHIYASRKDVWECIHKAALFVLTSDYEGMPNALMEAMALGLPCISTDCRPGGARTLIEDGVNGYVVPRQDVDKLAQRMDFLLTNDAEARRTGCEARRLQATHSNLMIFNKWEKFLKQLYCCRSTSKNC